MNGVKKVQILDGTTLKIIAMISKGGKTMPRPKKDGTHISLFLD